MESYQLGSASMDHWILLLQMHQKQITYLCLDDIQGSFKIHFTLRNDQEF